MGGSDSKKWEGLTPQKWEGLIQKSEGLTQMKEKV